MRHLGYLGLMGQLGLMGPETAVMASQISQRGACHG